MDHTKAAYWKRIGDSLVRERDAEAHPLPPYEPVNHVQCHPRSCAKCFPTLPVGPPRWEAGRWQECGKWGASGVWQLCMGCDASRIEQETRWNHDHHEYSLIDSQEEM